MIDGIHGEPEIFGSWQGFEGDDFEVVIDLQKSRTFSKVSTTFLQQYGAWIWLPSEVIYSVSDDGINFKKIFEEKNTVNQDKGGSFVKAFAGSVSGTNARYVKILAKNITTCPPWHPGAGGKAWLFVDEIEIE